MESCEIHKKGNWIFSSSESLEKYQLRKRIRYEEDEKKGCALTFEIIEGSSRKLNFDDNALPVQGIKMLNIIRWIRKWFDPVFAQHHGLGKMSRILANH
jgi:hypothetical protein